jgi:hypothetical protein
VAVQARVDVRRGTLWEALDTCRCGTMWMSTVKED